METIGVGLIDLLDRNAQKEYEVRFGLRGPRERPLVGASRSVGALPSASFPSQESLGRRRQLNCTKLSSYCKVPF